MASDKKGRTYTITFNSGTQVTFQSAELEVLYEYEYDANGEVLKDSDGAMLISNRLASVKAMAKDRGVSLIFARPDTIDCITRDTSDA